MGDWRSHCQLQTLDVHTMMSLLAALVSLSLQQPVPADSIKARLYVQGELTWYGRGPATDLSNRLVRIAAIRRLGFGGTRLPVEWVWVEPVRGQRNWARLDSTVAELKQAGLAAYGVIAYSPRWAVPAGVIHSPHFAAHRPVVDGSSAKGDTVFAGFAAAAARRYRGFIDRWEIWNEENHPAFWLNALDGFNRGADVDDYAHLFTLTRDSIRVANPGARVAVGGLASLNGVPLTWHDPLDSTRVLSAPTPQGYVRALVSLGVSFDAIGLHPYTTVPPGRRAFGRGVVFPDLVVDSVLDLLDELKLSGVDVWVTEWGVNAPFATSQTMLDTWFRDGLSALLCRKRIAFVTVHTLMDVNPQEHYGLLRIDGSETTDGIAFRRAMSGWTGCPSLR